MTRLLVIVILVAGALGATSAPVGAAPGGICKLDTVQAPVEHADGRIAGVARVHCPVGGVADFQVGVQVWTPGGWRFLSPTYPNPGTYQIASTDASLLNWSYFWNVSPGGAGCDPYAAYRSWFRNVLTGRVTAGASVNGSQVCTY